MIKWIVQVNSLFLQDLYFNLLKNSDTTVAQTRQYLPEFIFDSIIGGFQRIMHSVKNVKAIYT